MRGWRTGTYLYTYTLSPRLVGPGRLTGECLSSRDRQNDTHGRGPDVQGATMMAVVAPADIEKRRKRRCLGGGIDSGL